MQGYDITIGQGGMPNVTQHTLGRRPGIQGPNVMPGYGQRRPGLGGSMPGTARSQPQMNQPPWAQSLRSPHNSPNMSQPAALSRDMSGGVRPGNNMMGGPSVPPPQMAGPSLQQIQAEMARRQVGGQLGPRNGALAGYMMG